MFLRRLAPLLFLLTPLAHTQTILEHGVYTIHHLLRAVGSEEYTLTSAPAGYTLTSHSSPSDETLTLTLTPRTIFPASMPPSAQMMMIRSWKQQRQPARLMLAPSPGPALSVEIKLVGHDAYLSHGHMVRLARYTVSGLASGPEILWMNDSNRLAAIMIFAGDYPQQIVLDEYERLMGEIFHSGIRQQMLNLADLTRQLPPIAQGTYAITGSRLVDGTGAPAIPHSTVLIRNGFIAAAGPQSSIAIPPGMKVLHAEGKILLPGLWDTNAHYSGIEQGPALLARGITSVQDCGGELELLSALHRAIEQEHLLGPRLLLPPDTAVEPPPCTPTPDLDLDMQYGMSPANALESVTLLAARAAHHDADSGSITPGKRADLLLTEGAPDLTLSDLHRPAMVATAGRLYDTRKLAAAAHTPEIK